MAATIHPSVSTNAVPASDTTRALSRPLLRTAAVIYAIFALGHTFGAMLGDGRRGPRQAELFAAMRAYTFEVQGATRSYWDFYRGFGFMVSVLLAAMAVECWVLAGIGTRHPRQARSVVLVLTIAAAFVTWFSFVDFFALPMAFSAIGVIVLIAAAMALGREINDPSNRGASQ